MPRLAGLFIFFSTIAAAHPALRTGEALSYHVGWGPFFHAGDITISAAAAPGERGETYLKVLTTTATQGFARALYTFEARAEALFDERNGRLLTNREITKLPNKEKKYSVDFDYARSVAHYVNATEPAKSAALHLPAGDPFDIIMTLVQTRTWDLQPGQSRDALVIHEDEFYELTIHAVGYERVHTPLGDFNTLILEPRMEKGPAKGMFKRSASVRVWISQDAQRLPVKFQLEFKFGAGVATLAGYHPPAATPAQASAAAAAKPDEKHSGS